MCVTDMPSRRQGLWWSLVGYFRAYPPLIQSEGVRLDDRRRTRDPADAAAAKTGRPRIRIYW